MFREHLLQNLSFDGSLTPIWGAWASGACLRVDLSPEHASVVACTPSYAMNAFGDDVQPRLLLVGGEACPALLHKKYNNLDLYGPTETCCTTTVSRTPNTIGRPLPNYVCYVVHPLSGRLCPPLVAGELWIGGIVLARGYHGKPELTHERFLANPFYANGFSVISTVWE